MNKIRPMPVIPGIPDNTRLNPETGYLAGTCNIGPAEVAKRTQMAIFTVAVTVLGIALIQLLRLQPGWRLLVAIPAGAAGVNVFQVYAKFCVAFGLAGVFNFGETGNRRTVGLGEYLKRDRRKAVWMLFVGGASGAALALGYYFLPV